MAQPVAPAPAPGYRYAVGTWPVSRLLFFVAAILFVIAALAAGGTFATNWLPWALGALAAAALGFALP
jgi:hypothetical protein